MEKWGVRVGMMLKEMWRGRTMSDEKGSRKVYNRRKYEEARDIMATDKRGGRIEWAQK